MLLTRRAAIKGLLVTGIGAVTGATTYGVAFERHHIGVTEAALPVSGLPPALDGLRIGSADRHPPQRHGAGRRRDARG